MRDADLNFEDLKRFKYSARDLHEIVGCLGQIIHSINTPTTCQVKSMIHDLLQLDRLG